MAHGSEPDRAVAAYDATADLYAARIGTEITSAIEGPIDRALLAAFVEVAAPSGGLVADIGCGTGRVAAFLAAHGLRVVGIEPSSGMRTVATAVHPDLRLLPGTVHSLPAADGELAAAVCWYSIIHSPPDRLCTAFQEIGRALIEGGHLLLAFQAGKGEAVQRDSVLGRAVALTNYRHDPDHVAEQLRLAGFGVTSTTVRTADHAFESTPQAFVLAVRGRPTT